MKTPSTINELKNMMDELGVSLPISEDISVLGEKISIGSLTSPNRFVALPMEGADAADDGGPSELTFRRYERMALGGAGIIWLEACAVQQDGCSNPKSLLINECNLNRYKELVDRIRQAARESNQHEVICILQLTHSGRYSKPFGKPSPIITHHNPALDALQNLPDDYPIVSDDALDQIQASFIKSAILARRAGFDGVDIKSCHGYLVSGLLAAHTRTGKYGGAYENRTRFLKETIALIKKESPSLIMTTRMNAFDGTPYPYGFGVSRDDADIPDLSEPIQLAKELVSMGVPILNISIGNPYFNARYNRPSATSTNEHPLFGISRFVHIVGEIQKQIPNIPVVTGGLAWLGQQMPFVAAGLIKGGEAQLIGQGRNSIAYPDCVNDILKHNSFSEKKCCITCSICSQLLRNGKNSGCVVRDRAFYSIEKNAQ